MSMGRIYRDGLDFFRMGWSLQDMTRYVSPDFCPFGQKSSSQNSMFHFHRDRGCLFFRMIEMIAERKELMSTLMTH
jgi:hypothetical protein